MGWGRFIVLTCKCGFETNRAMIGHLLAHESSSGGFTAIETTYDAANRRIVEHATTLPANLEDRLNRDTPEDEDTVNSWFDDQRKIIQGIHGHILHAPEEKETTAFQCPECRVSNLVLVTVGSWIA